MKKKIQLLASGISLVDKTWGGFYRGGSYLLVGPRKSGKTLLGLQFAMESANQGEVCLYFTSMRPKDLMIHAASIDFDLQHYMNQNMIIVVRVTSPLELNETGDADQILTEYLNDIVSVVEQYQPGKLIFDEITPFVSYNNINLLQNTYSGTIEKIEELGVTSLFLLGQPVTPAARLIVDTLAGNSTGIISLEKKDPESHRIEGGRITIIPNIGHTEGDFTANYSVEPYKGILDDYKQSQSKDKSRKYKTLDQFNVIEEKPLSTNIYPLNELKLIINNQIALFRSTGQTFEILSLQLDPEAEKKGLLTFNQLQSSVKLAMEKKDRMCISEQKLFILIPRTDQKSVAAFAARLRNNLPGTKDQYLDQVLPYISLLNLKVDENIENADSLINKLVSEGPSYNEMK
jgi:circadian clock protein KaiC